MTRSDVEGKIKKQLIDIPIEDITDRLHSLMKTAEEDCAFYAQPAYYQSNTGLTEATGNAFVPKTLKFVELVKNHGLYDIKRQSDWLSDWYVYEGDIVRNDAPGNMLFGYVGKVFMRVSLSGKGGDVCWGTVGAYRTSSARNSADSPQQPHQNKKTNPKIGLFILVRIRGLEPPPSCPD